LVLFLGHGFGTIPAPGSFADSALFGFFSISESSAIVAITKKLFS